MRSFLFLVCLAPLLFPGLQYLSGQARTTKAMSTRCTAGVTQTGALNRQHLCVLRLWAFCARPSTCSCSGLCVCLVDDAANRVLQCSWLHNLHAGLVYDAPPPSLLWSPAVASECGTATVSLDLTSGGRRLLKVDSRAPSPFEGTRGRWGALPFRWGQQQPRRPKPGNELDVSTNLFYACVVL